MLAPREWRIETAEEFDSDWSELSDNAPRPEAHIRIWRWWLERRPFQFTHGLTSPQDEMRYIVTQESTTNEEYVVGLTVDRTRHVVTLRWLDVVPL